MHVLPIRSCHACAGEGGPGIPGAIPGGISAGVLSGGGAGSAAHGGAAHSDSELAMDAKKARRKQRLAMQKALLNAEKAKVGR